MLVEAWHSSELTRNNYKSIPPFQHQNSYFTFIVRVFFYVSYFSFTFVFVFTKSEKRND